MSRCNIVFPGKGFLLLAIILCTGCNRTGSQNVPPTEVSALRLTPSPITTFSDYPATIEGATDTEIRPQVEGYIVSLSVDEGQMVKQGKPLFQIDNRIYTQRLAEARSGTLVAESQLSKASIELRNGDELQKAGVISSVEYDLLKVDYELAKANVMQANAAMERARIELDFTTVKAPVDGVVGKINYRTGTLVGPSSPAPLTTVSDISHVRAYFSIGEHDYLDLLAGNGIKMDSTEVELLLANGQSHVERGKIDALNGKFSSSGGSILLRASFPNSRLLLRTGNTGKVRIAHTEPEALLIPKRMTVRIQNKTMVYRIDNQRLSFVCIEVVEGDEEHYIVRSGIDAGSVILANKLQTVHDGMKVTIKLIEP